MTSDEVRAAAKRVVQWLQRFVGLFGRNEPQGHSLIHLKGLMSEQKRKSVEPIAPQFARRLKCTSPAGAATGKCRGAQRCSRGVLVRECEADGRGEENWVDLVSPGGPKAMSPVTH
jgi:hypothetical protein